MTEYEIHILSRDGSSIVSTLKLFSVQGAISSAVRIARGRASKPGAKAGAFTPTLPGPCRHRPLRANRPPSRP